ncbi:MAG: hypothetical protein HY906_20440, partial [Deltaproteobacteria bacterium]|nr:hypothetical protein [Deltaproteobacteria bacterium]
VRSYGYDALYRLTRETISGGPLAAYEKQFGYDRVGNRLSQVTTGAGAASVGYTYDTRDRIQTENSLAYSFDVNGNLVGKDGQATYVWDFDNRLIEVHLASGALVEHQYDVDGTRVRTKLTPPTGPPTETNFLVDTAGALSHVVAETDGAGTLQALYVRGDDLLSIHRPGQVRYVHADGLGFNAGRRQYQIGRRERARPARVRWSTRPARRRFRGPGCAWRLGWGQGSGAGGGAFVVEVAQRRAVGGGT